MLRILPIWALAVSVGCGARTEYPPEVKNYERFLREESPPTGVPDLDAKWKELAKDVAGLGPGAATHLADLYRRALSGENMGFGARDAFFMPIWLLPKPDLRDAGLILVKQQEAYTQINGLWALGLVHKDGDLRFVLDLVESPNEEVAAYATYCLGFWPADGIAEALAPLFKSGRARVRVQACVAALNAGARSFATHLWQVAADDPYFPARCFALEALASAGDEKASAELFKYVKNAGHQGDEAAVRILFIQALIRVGTYDEWPVVAEALDDPDEIVAALAALYLLQSPEEEARERANAKLKENDALRENVRLFGKDSQYAKVDREDGNGYMLYSPPK